MPLGSHDIDAARLSVLKHGLGEFRRYEVGDGLVVGAHPAGDLVKVSSA